MTDKQLEPVIRTWLHGTDRPPADSHRSTGQIMARLPERERRRRLWPFLRQTSSVSQSPTHDRITDHRASPIPDTIGHTPTVNGRTQTMLSPVSAITAGAIVFALGGVMLIAQPFDQQEGSVPGAATDTEIAAPVEFSGKIAFGPCTGTPEYESVDGRVRTLSASVGAYCEPPVIEPFSDPRLQGEYYVWQNNDLHFGGPTIYATAFSIVTEEGAWRGIPDVFIEEAASGDQVLVGEGAYEGLTAIATVELDGDVWDWHGFIVDGGLPPLPEEPEAIP